MGEWEKIFLQNLVVPPHNQRRRPLPLRTSTGFQCILKHVEGSVLKQKILEDAVGVEFQLRLSFFDAAFRHFFGKTWKSASRPAKAAQGELPAVVFNEAAERMLRVTINY